MFTGGKNLLNTDCSYVNIVRYTTRGFTLIMTVIFNLRETYRSDRTGMFMF